MKHIFFSKFSLLNLAILGLLSILPVKLIQAKTTQELPYLSSDIETTVSQPDCSAQISSLDEYQGLTLSNAICIAVKRHPSIASAAAYYSGQESMVSAAKSGYYPRVNASIQTNRNTNTNFDDSGVNKYVTTSRIAASQMLYDFGKVKSSVAEARGQTEQQRATLLAKIDEIANKTGEAIISVLRLQALEAKTLDMITGIQRVTTIANDRAESGLSTQSDSIQAKARLEAAEAGLLSIRTELKQHRVRLRTYLGDTYQNTVLAPIPDYLFNQSLFRLKADATKIPAIIAANASKSIAEAQYSAATADLFPTLSLDLSTEKAITGVNANTGKKNGKYYYVGLSVNQSLFSGGERVGRRRSAAHMVHAATYDINSMQLDLNEQAQSIREYITGTEGRLKVLNLRKQSINQTRDLYQEQYKLGTRPVLDLLNAEQEIYQAEADEVNARYDMWIYYMNYIVVTGNARRLFSLDGLIQTSIGN